MTTPTPTELALEALSTLYNAEDGSREKDAAYEVIEAALDADRAEVERLRWEARADEQANARLRELLDEARAALAAMTERIEGLIETPDAIGPNGGRVDSIRLRVALAAPARPTTDDREALDHDALVEAVVEAIWPVGEPEGAWPRREGIYTVAERVIALASRPTTPTPTVSEEQVRAFEQRIEGLANAGPTWVQHRGRSGYIEGWHAALSALLAATPSDTEEGR